MAMDPALPSRVASLSCKARVSPFEYVTPSSVVWESTNSVYSPAGQILLGSPRRPPSLGHQRSPLVLARVLLPATAYSDTRTPPAAYGFSRYANRLGAKSAKSP